MNSNTIAIIDCASIVERKLETALRDQQLSVAQLRILEHADTYKGKITPSQLAALLLQETHSVSGLLNRLEDRDLITRTRDRQDRRVVWVALTLTGETVLMAAQGAVRAAEKDFSAPTSGGRGDVIAVTRNAMLKLLPQKTLDIRAEMAALASHNDAAARTPVAAGR